MGQLITDGNTFIVDKLFVGNQIPVLVKGISLKGEQGTLSRGTVISLDTDGKAVISDKVGVTDTLYGILTDDVVTGVGATDYTIAEVYITGYFNSGALKFAVGSTIDDFGLDLRKLGIFTDTVKEA